MKKSDRELVYRKYEGRCAYCGQELTKGWHVDHIEPVRRLTKFIPPHYINRETGERVERGGFAALFKLPEGEKDAWKYVPEKEVPDGFLHPERNTVSNMLPACASCNINKHGGSIEDFRELIAGFMKHLNGVNTQYKIAKRYGLVEERIKPVKFYFEQLSQAQTARNP